MALTRAEVESILVRRCRGWMTVASLAITYAGVNADLNDPISSGLLASGYSVTNYAVVSTTDLAQVTNDYLPLFLDHCELRLLNNIASNIDVVDVTLGPDQEKLGQFHNAIRSAISAKIDYMSKMYGIVQGKLEAGYIEIGSVQESG